MSYCYKATLAILAFILIAFTVVCTGCLVLLGVAVSDCDLTCDEDADEAELLNEGYYACDGTAQKQTQASTSGFDSLSPVMRGCFVVPGCMPTGRRRRILHYGTASL